MVCENRFDKITSERIGDRIKGLKLRRFGKLNSTYYSKLRQPHHSSAAATVDKMINLSTAASHLLQHLVNFGALAIVIGRRIRRDAAVNSSTAAPPLLWCLQGRRGVPQFESFYTALSEKGFVRKQSFLRKYN